MIESLKIFHFGFNEDDQLALIESIQDFFLDLVYVLTLTINNGRALFFYHSYLSTMTIIIVDAFMSTLLVC